MLALLLGTSAARPLRTPLPVTSTGASCWSVATPWARAGSDMAAMASAMAPSRNGRVGGWVVVMVLLSMKTAPVVARIDGQRERTATASVPQACRSAPPDGSSAGSGWCARLGGGPGEQRGKGSGPSAGRKSAPSTAKLPADSAIGKAGALPSWPHSGQCPRWEPASACEPATPAASAMTTLPPATEQISAQGLPGPEAASACDTVGASARPSIAKIANQVAPAEQASDDLHGAILTTDKPKSVPAAAGRRHPQPACP